MQNPLKNRDEIRIGIVVSEFNNEITFAMLSEAKRYAKELSSKITYVCFVPGVFDMPIMVQEILKKNTKMLQKIKSKS